MSAENISEDIMESIKATILENISQLIPQLIQEITPSIIDLTKDIITKFLRENNNIQESIKRSVITCEKEVKNFKQMNQRYMSAKLDKREDEYYKNARCNHMLSLYNDCLSNEPLYIPRKFRSDSYHVTSEAELSIITKMDLKKFQSECEILKLRQDEYAKRISEIDQEIDQFIIDANVSSEAQQKLLDRWNTCITEDVNKIEKKWDSKTESTKKAFEKDRLYHQNHQQNRVRNSNQSSHHLNNANNTDTNSTTQATNDDLSSTTVRNNSRSN